MYWILKFPLILSSDPNHLSR